MRVVLDANVMVAAFATRGLCAELLEIVLSSHRILSSEPLLAEVEVALVRKVRLPAALASDAVAFVRRHAEIAVPARVPASACRDRKDLHVLGLALAASADVVVSGDRDLLDLEVFRGIPIDSPRAFWERLRK